MDLHLRRVIGLTTREALEKSGSDNQRGESALEKSWQLEWWVCNLEVGLAARMVGLQSRSGSGNINGGSAPLRRVIGLTTREALAKSGFGS